MHDIRMKLKLLEKKGDAHLFSSAFSEKKKIFKQKAFKNLLATVQEEQVAKEASDLKAE